MLWTANATCMAAASVCTKFAWLRCPVVHDPRVASLIWPNVSHNPGSGLAAYCEHPMGFIIYVGTKNISNPPSKLLRDGIAELGVMLPHHITHARRI